ncbi:dTMP kinase_gp003 [Bacillus phage vB_BceM_WH1]|nr:dTMP kinase_gp003 [Bacillus phage vB_BceM_WH1]
MLIIALEGLDKAGKFSQAKVIKEYLEAKGYKVATSEFHRYDTPTGELILKWLTGEYNVDQKTIELIMAADKQAQQQWFYELEQEGYQYLILDRYIHSQYAYGLSTGSDKEWLDEMLYFLREPDIVVYIDIDAETSMARKGKHNNGENDRYESDKRLLERVRETYQSFAQYEDKPEKFFPGYQSFFTINGMQPVDDVTKDIRELFDKLTPKFY